MALCLIFCLITLSPWLQVTNLQELTDVMSDVGRAFGYRVRPLSMTPGPQLCICVTLHVYGTRRHLRAPMLGIRMCFPNHVPMSAPPLCQLQGRRSSPSWRRWRAPACWSPATARSWPTPCSCRLVRPPSSLELTQFMDCCADGLNLMLETLCCCKFMYREGSGDGLETYIRHVWKNVQQISVVALP